jgi:tRNA-Thr(GGU) m(6)t(6)A37 methyltransferase TsaA
MNEVTIRPIAHIESDFPEKFGIPRQAGIVEKLRGRVVFDGEYRNDEALRGIEGFSHLWLIWQFSENVRDDFSPTVRPPRLGGNTRLGVFATRSPFRPNALGLSCVRLLGLEKTEDKGTVLLVAGADLMDGTPIFDVKPYLPYADCHPDAAGGFAPDPGERLEVVFPAAALEKVPPDKREALRGVLENDPRPGYRADGDEEYGMKFSDFEVFFTVSNDTLTVTKIK